MSNYPSGNRRVAPEHSGDLINREGYLMKSLRGYKDADLFAIMEDSERLYESNVERLKKRIVFPNTDSHLDPDRIISFDYVDDVNKYRIAAYNCKRILDDRGHYIMAGRELREK